MIASKQAVLDILERHGPLTSADIVKRCDFRKATVNSRLAQLHRAGQIHICAWPERESGSPSAQWKFGNGDDAPHRSGRPAAAGSLLQRIRRATEAGCGPFACLIGQMGNGR